MAINLSYNLPTIQVPAKPVFAALVPATGNGTSIPFIIDPTTVASQVSARYEEVSLWKGGSYPIWRGQAAERLTVSCTVYQRANSDISPVLNLMRGAVGQDKLWLFSWGQRTVGPVALTDVSIEENAWEAGLPVMATANLTMVRVGVLPVLTSKASGLTAAEKKAGLTAAAKGLGVKESQLTISDTGQVKKGTTVVGTYSNGRFKKA